MSDLRARRTEFLARAVRCSCVVFLLAFALGRDAQAGETPRLTIVCHDESGRPLSGVWFKVRSQKSVAASVARSLFGWSAGASDEGTTDHDGRVVLAPPLGRPVLLATYRPQWSAKRLTTLFVTPATNRTLEFVVPTDGLRELRGRVTIDGLAPDRISLAAETPLTPLRPGAFFYPSVNEAGEFERRLPPGNYRVYARRPRADPMGLIGLAHVPEFGDEPARFDVDVSTVEWTIEHGEDRGVFVVESLGEGRPVRDVESGARLRVVPGSYRVLLSYLGELDGSTPVTPAFVDVEVRRSTNQNLTRRERTVCRLWKGHEPWVYSTGLSLSQPIFEDPPRFVDADGVVHSVQFVDARGPDPWPEARIDSIELPSGVPGEAFVMNVDEFWRGRWSGRESDPVEWNLVTNRVGALIVRDVPTGADRVEIERRGGSSFERVYWNARARPVHDAPGSEWEIRLPVGTYDVDFFSGSSRLESRPIECVDIGLHDFVRSTQFVADAHPRYERSLFGANMGWIPRLPFECETDRRRLRLRDANRFQRDRDEPGTLIALTSTDVYARRIERDGALGGSWDSRPLGGIDIRRAKSRSEYTLQGVMPSAVWNIRFDEVRRYGDWHRVKHGRVAITLEAMPGRYLLLEDGEIIGLVEVRAYASSLFDRERDGPP